MDMPDRGGMESTTSANKFLMSMHTLNHFVEGLYITSSISF
jgi:hypothetical protein